MLYKDAQVRTIEISLKYLGKFIKKQYADDIIKFATHSVTEEWKELDDFSEDFD